MYGWSMYSVTALSGVDWQGEPMPQCDGSLFPSQRLQLYHRTGSPPYFPPKRKAEEGGEKGKAWEPIKKNEPFYSWVLNFPIQQQWGFFFKKYFYRIFFFLAYIS